MAVIPIIGAKHEVIDLKPEEIATFAAFERYLSRHGLGIHCAKCEQDLSGTNRETDGVLSVSCLCREFKASNPRRRPEPPAYEKPVNDF